MLVLVCYEEVFCDRLGDNTLGIYAEVKHGPSLRLYIGEKPDFCCGMGDILKAVT